MKHLVPVLLIVAGLVHLVPVTGVLGGDRLAALYGVTTGDANLAILLRHRAVLFGLLGMLLVYAALRPALQPLALAAGLMSTVSFLAIALSVGNYNAALGRVVAADVVAVGCLALAAVAVLFGRSGS